MTKKSVITLTDEEKSIVKSLLSRDWRNQDIQALINIHRPATVNSGRITEIKQDDAIELSSDDATDFFIKKKYSFDPKTGLNLYDDERLIRAREAMIVAVQIFNNPNIQFKTEVFAVQANIAWTYLLHEFFERKGIKIEDKDGRTLLLSKMLRMPDFPLSKGIKNNISDLIEIRDEVSHKLLRQSGHKFFPKFQACCLNFDKSLSELFGKKTSLQHELSLALQFAKLDFEQLETLHKYDVPEHISALDARLNDRISEDEKKDTEYQFRVVYILESSSKSKSHIQFINSGSKEGKEIHNVLEKKVLSDKEYPFKPTDVYKAVAQKSKKNFTMRNHIQAMYLFKARPKGNNKNPENTKKEWCIYHTIYRSYSYTQAWIDHLVEQVLDNDKFDKIKKYKL